MFDPVTAQKGLTVDLMFNANDFTSGGRYDNTVNRISASALGSDQILFISVQTDSSTARTFDFTLRSVELALMDGTKKKVPLVYEEYDLTQALYGLDSSVDTLYNRVGDLNYSSNNYVVDSESATLSIGKLDDKLKAVADQVSGGVSSDLTELRNRVGTSTTLNAYDGADTHLTAIVNKLGSNVGDLEYTSTHFLNEGLHTDVTMALSKLD
jgi:hypothetical protein